MELLYFISGAIFVMFIMPIGDAILSFFVMYLEAKKAKYSEAINYSKIRIEQAINEVEKLEPSIKRPIGFMACEEKEKEDDNDEV